MITTCNNKKREINKKREFNKKQNKKTKNTSVIDSLNTYENEYGEIVIVGQKILTDEERYQSWYRYLTHEEKKDKENVKAMWEERELRRQRTLVEMKKLEEAREKIKKQGQQSVEEIQKELDDKERRWKRALELRRMKERGEEIVYTAEEIEERETRKKITEILQRRYVDQEYFGGAEAKEYEKFMRDEDDLSDEEVERIKKNTIIMTKEQREQAKKKRDERIAEHWRKQEELERIEQEKRKQEEEERVEREKQEEEERVEREKQEELERIERERIEKEEEEERQEKERRKRKFREITEKREKMLRESKKE